MALFASLRSRRLASRAAEAFARGGLAAAAAVLDEPHGLAGEPWAQLAVHLYNEDHKDDAERAIRRALDVEPGRGDALIFLAELFVETQRVEEAIETYRALLARRPGATAEAHALARLLAERGDHEGVKVTLAPFAANASIEMRLLLAEALYEVGEPERVVELLAPTMTEMRVELQGMLPRGSLNSFYEQYQDVSRLHDDAYAAVHGRERVIETATKQAQLDARAGVNYSLLGMARMTASPKWTPDLRLRSVAETRAFAETLVAAGERSRGLCHLGVAALRRGLLDEARERFDAAREEDDDNFAAYLGLGAAMELEKTEAFDRLEALPGVAPPAGLTGVVVDWPALTDEERKVVALLAAPLAGLLPAVVAAGGRALILPIDARLADLPEMAPHADERADDHRCLAGITGAANSRVSSSKIEELLHILGENASVFAHELAHLCHFHAPEALNARIDALYARALEHEHVLTTYQTTNVAEFFAVAYTDYLAHRHRLPVRRELDEEGIIEETFALIDELGG